MKALERMAQVIPEKKDYGMLTQRTIIHGQKCIMCGRRLRPVASERETASKAW